VRQRLNHLIHVPFEFETAGSQIIFYEPGEDYLAQETARNNQVIRPARELNPTEETVPA
jgi:D-glycero-alpha-D-manno-heptose-7-phosphate kinase